MMSRSFGDRSGHKVGMVAIPGRKLSYLEVRTFRKTAQDSILILGSDGVWEKTPDQNFVSSCQKNHLMKNSAEKICKELVSIAANKWDTVGFYDSGMRFLS